MSRIAGMLLAGGLGLAACSQPSDRAAKAEAPVKAAAPADIEGYYERGPNPPGGLRVTRVGEQYRIEVDAAGDQALGDAVPADCIWAAMGPLREGRIVAVPVPFSTQEDGPVDREPRDPQQKVEIAFEGGIAVVTRADVDDGCGVGTDSTGRYKKTNRIPDHWPTFRY